MGENDLPEDVLTDLEYEDCYREALTLLEQKLGGKERPMVAQDGKRRCIVSGFAFDDTHLFRLAWGVRVAEDICRRRSVFLKTRSAAEMK